MRKAFVTGGTGSIGSSIVRELVNCDYSVTFQYATNDSGAEALAKATGATALRFDLSGSNMPDLGDVDALVNSAGIILAKSSVELVDDEELDRTLAINVWAPFRLTRAVAPGMITRQWGRIVNIGSIYAQRGCTNNSSYNISKHALLGLTRSAAWDLAPHGITVNQIDPSAVDSDIIDGLAQRYAAAGTVTEQEYKDRIAASIPVGRLANPRDIAAAVAYFCSEHSSFTTGQTLAVDGGVIA